MKVAILESSEHIIKRLVDLISETNPGLSFESATNYEDAHLLLQEAPPGVLLVDVRFFGFCFEEELLAQIRQLKKCGTSIIVLYHIMSKYTNELYKEFGADYFVDLYLEFDNIPGIISDINNKTHDDTMKDPVFYPSSN